MAISKYTADREKQKFLESDAVAGQVAVAVVNPDGSSLSGTGTTSMQVQGASADNAAVTEAPVLTGAEYNATPPTYDDGDKTTTQADVNGNTKVVIARSTSAANAPLNATSSVYASNIVAKTSAGVLYGFSGYNSKASAQFIQIHNVAAIPGDGQTPVYILTVPATSNFNVSFGERGRYFSTGIVLVNSSTSPTKTVGSADCWFDVQYA